MLKTFFSCKVFSRDGGCVVGGRGCEAETRDHGPRAGRDVTAAPPDLGPRQCEGGGGDARQGRWCRQCNLESGLQ